MGDQADAHADLAAPFTTGPIPPEFDDPPAPLHPYTCGGQMNGCRLCEQDTSITPEGEADDEYDGPGTAPAEPDAASVAARITDKVQAALALGKHLPCSLAEFAAMTSDDSGAVVAVCGCGEFFPLEGLVDGARTLSDAEVQVRPGNTVTVHAADPIARQAALIPQGVHLTPEMLEQNILDVLERLEKGGAFERMCIEQEAAAKTAYTIAYARAFNQATGPVEVRNQAAIEATIPELEARDEAIMIRKAVQASLHTLRSVLSGYQTVNGNVRAAMNAGGSPGRG